MNVTPIRDRILARIVPRALGLLLLSACCSTTGEIHVGHPQVQTRERLVEERHGEVEWLRGQLALTDKIETRFQGIRDLKTSVELQAQLKATYDPALGAVNKLDQDNKELEKKAEYWRLKTKEAEERNKYQAVLSGGSPAPAVTPVDGKDGKDGKEGKEGATGKDGKDATQSSGKSEVSSANAGLLDLLHDKLAFRNAVNAAIKFTQLDDAHDQKGMTLYQLNLDLMIVPGDSTERYAQVTLSIAPEEEGEKRVLGMTGLYYLWFRSLQTRLSSETARLRHLAVRLATEPVDSLTAEDRRDLQWLARYAAFGLPATESYLKRRDEAFKSLKSAPSKTNALEFLHGFRGYPLLDSPLVTDENLKTETYPWWEFERSHYRSVASVPNKFSDVNTPNLLMTLATKGSSALLSGKNVADVVQLAPWAVWSKYHADLGRIVDVQEPIGDEAPTVAHLRAFVKPDDLQRAGLCPAPEGWTDNKYFSTGQASFAGALLEIEQRPHAVSIEPKEHAQNISDVSARDSLLKLTLGLQAMLKGVTLGLDTSYESKERELLQAIQRRPLLVGFGMGKRDFGWVAGPKFVIQDQEVGFLHSPARHDCSASIVVPAWWTKARLTGSVAWVDDNGKLSNKYDLWKSSNKAGDKEGCLIELPMPADAFERLTHALTSSSLSPGSYASATRPKPLLERAQSDTQEVLVAGGHRTLLLRGKELWRNPQVFLGSRKANRVEVLSDMEGLLAHFDALEYPGGTPGTSQGVEVDARVITTFGSDSLKNAVRILPGEAPRPGLPQALAKATSVTFKKADGSADGGLTVTIRKDAEGMNAFLANALAALVTKPEGEFILRGVKGGPIGLKITTWAQDALSFTATVDAATLKTLSKALVDMPDGQAASSELIIPGVTGILKIAVQDEGDPRKPASFKFKNEAP